MSSDLSWSSRGNDHGVYVIELPGSETVAFEARSHADAEEVVRTGWFVQALDCFCSNGLCPRNTANFLRVATDHEAVAFHELAEEFAEEMVGTFLVAYLGREKHAALV